MGSTGSTWLAKLLNSHPDVFCSHEGVLGQVGPLCGYGDPEIQAFLTSLAWNDMHGAYRAIGDVGSVWSGHAANLPFFTTGLLVRHPARILHTRLRVYPGDRSYTDIAPDSQQCVRELWGIESRKYEPIDQIFLHDAFTFASQVWAMSKVTVVFRIEELQYPARCARILQTLTGIAYPPSLIVGATGTRLNQRSSSPQPVADIVAGFTPRQRDWYRVILQDVAPYIGYDLWDDQLATATSLEQDAENRDAEDKDSVQVLVRS